MATTSELRRYPRFSAPKGTILAWQTANHREVSKIAILGLGGLYIHTNYPVPVGTIIQLLIEGPTGEIRARAVVQDSKPGEGMGVKIVSMQPEDRARYSRWLDRLSV